MANPVEKIRTFYEETVLETKKCSWPTRRELWEQTLLVIFATIFSALFVGLVDIICQRVIQFIVTGSF